LIDKRGQSCREEVAAGADILPRGSHAAAALDDGIYVFGGFGDGKTLSDVLVLKSGGTEWSNVSATGPAPAARCVGDTGLIVA
jgi:hypothetical protein